MVIGGRSPDAGAERRRPRRGGRTRGFWSVAWAASVIGVSAAALCATPAGAETPVSALASGAGSVCALANSGGVECWGWNYYGQLGFGTDVGPDICGWGSETYPIGCAIAPVAVRNLGSGVSAISDNYAGMCALRSVGDVLC